MDSVTIFGKAAQKIIDDYGELSALDDVYRTRLFRDALVPYKGAITNARTDAVNVLIPPSLAARARARGYLRTSSLLNLLIGPVFESNENNMFVYFVGDREDPVTRAFPNINLAEGLGEGLDTLFWKDFFKENVPYWEHYYTDATLRDAVTAAVGSPVTFDPPYEDAAGQGKIITLFYPLWNASRRTVRRGGSGGRVSCQDPRQRPGRPRRQDRVRRAAQRRRGNHRHARIRRTRA